MAFEPTPPKTAPDPMIGRVIAGKYRIQSRVGGGAMGVVYEAKQMALDKRVAIKVLNRELERNAHFVARFQVEAKAASLLDHANSTRVFDFGKDANGLLYICMEFLEGQSLYELIQAAWPFESARVVDLMAQTLAALARAHDMGILHRDLKPENIVVLQVVDDEGRTRDVVKVCDFGIAKLEGNLTVSDTGDTQYSGHWKTGGAGAALTQVGLIVGTPDYMSPEQARGETVDARSEIYSVGVVLYHMLAGRPPFDGADVMEILTKHVTDEAPAPSSFNPQVDPELEEICRTAMSKDPAKRYRSAREMRAALRSTAAAHGIGSVSGPHSSVSELDPMTPMGSFMTSRAPTMPVPSLLESLPLSRGSSVPNAFTKTENGTLSSGSGLESARGSGPTSVMAPGEKPRTLGIFIAGALTAAALAAAFVVWSGRNTRGTVTLPVAAPVTTPPTLVAATPSPTGTGGSSDSALAASAAPTAPATAAPSTSAESAAPGPAPVPVPMTAAAPAPPYGGRGSGSASNARNAPAAVEIPAPAPVASAPPVVSAAPPPVPVPAPAPAPPPIAPTPAAVAPAAPPPFHPENGHVAVGGVAVDRVSAHSVNDLLRHVNLDRCYVAALRTHGSAASGTAVLTLDIEQNQVSRAHLGSDVGLSDMRGCIESQFNSLHVADADTGDASARITLQFSDP
jgi:serine/threonine protein kinase